MNGFAMISKMYRDEAAAGEMSQECAERYCRIYDFLASCDEEDFYIMFDSTAFNEISKAYLKKAVKELTAEGEITEEQGKSVRSRFSFLFDECPSKPICKS